MMLKGSVKLPDAYPKAIIAIKTTGLAGGLLTPYKGLLLAKPKGLLKKIPLLQYMLRYPTGTIFLWYLYFFGFHFLSPYDIIYLLT